MNLLMPKEMTFGIKRKIRTRKRRIFGSIRNAFGSCRYAKRLVQRLFKVKETIIALVRPSPAVEVKIATQKVPIFTLTTVYPIFSPTVHSLLFFKYYFLIILFYFFFISLSLSDLPLTLRSPPTPNPSPQSQ
jgi:hypothetical protein